MSISIEAKREYDRQYYDRKYKGKGLLRQADPRKRRESNWRQRGIQITCDEYDAILSKQENRCAICKKHVFELKRPLAVDHCHESGRIRGLLCGPCNRALGLLKDNPDLLKKAFEYLCIDSILESRNG